MKTKVMTIERGFAVIAVWVAALAASAGGAIYDDFNFGPDAQWTTTIDIANNASASSSISGAAGAYRFTLIPASTGYHAAIYATRTDDVFANGKVSAVFKQQSPDYGLQYVLLRVGAGGAGTGYMAGVNGAGDFFLKKISAGNFVNLDSGGGDTDLPGGYFRTQDFILELDADGTTLTATTYSMSFQPLASVSGTDDDYSGAGAVGLLVAGMTGYDWPGGDGQVQLTFDDFRTGPVPEPATLVMLGMGGLGMLLRRKRRA